MGQCKLHNGLSILLISLLLTDVPAIAQTDNYWSWNFNTPSTLLAGAVVGGSAGPSAVYYNPALIDQENIPSLSLSASIISLQFFKAQNIAGEGIDADKFIFKIQPRFLSYVLPNENDRLGMEAAILSPVSEEIEYTIQHFDELDIIKRTQGTETYSGYLKYARTFDETWAGFGLSYKISNNIYLGMSSFLAIKLLRYEYRQHAEAFQPGDSVVIDQMKEPRYIASSGFEEEMKYWDLSLVFKGGFQYKSNNERLSVGANITFPNIKLYGEADLRKAYTRSNIFDNNASAFTSNDIIIGYETKARTRVKTPFSTAIGAQYTSSNMKNSISITLEYFHEIDDYALLEVPEHNYTNNYLNGLIDGRNFMPYFHAARSVVNAAIGVNKYISPKLAVLGGLRTDFTSGDQDNIRFLEDRFKINQIHFNKYHFTVGPVLTIKQFDVLTGIQYTYARNNDISSIINYANPVEYIPQTEQALEGLRQNAANASVNEIALFFGLTVGFIK